ncbi:MAG: hypothetical protein QM737_09905 [Ferruginibacter sp.]
MNFITRLFTAISAVVAIILGVLAIVANKDTPKAFHTPLYILGGVLIFFIMLLALTYDWLAKIGHNASYVLQKIYSDFIYNSINGRLEYLKDDGSLVSYERNDHMVKLSLKRSKRRVIVPVEVDGEIISKSIYGINNSFHLPTQSSVVFQCYFDDKNILNKEYISSYSFQIKNSFTKGNEFWIMKSEKYCRRYTFNIFLPADRTLKNAVVLYRQKPRNDNGTVSILQEKDKPWNKVEEPVLLIKRRKKHTILTMHVTGLKPTDMYKMVWELN